MTVITLWLTVLFQGGFYLKQQLISAVFIMTDILVSLITFFIKERSLKGGAPLSEKGRKKTANSIFFIVLSMILFTALWILASGRFGSHPVKACKRACLFFVTALFLISLYISEEKKIIFLIKNVVFLGAFQNVPLIEFALTGRNSVFTDSFRDGRFMGTFNYQNVTAMYLLAAVFTGIYMGEEGTLNQKNINQNDRSFFRICTLLLLVPLSATLSVSTIVMFCIGMLVIVILQKEKSFKIYIAGLFSSVFTFGILFMILRNHGLFTENNIRKKARLLTPSVESSRNGIFLLYLIPLLINLGIIVFFMHSEKKSSGSGQYGARINTVLKGRIKKENFRTGFSERRKLLSEALVTAFCGAACLLIFRRRAGRSLYMRIRMISDALGVILRHPLWGRGAGTWKRVSRRTGRGVYHSALIHSFPIHISFECGIIPGILIIAAFAAVTVQIVRIYREDRRKGIYGAVISGCVFLHILFDIEMFFFGYICEVVIVLFYFTRAARSGEVTQPKKRR